MKTFTAIREDLKNIRYYYARRDEMAQKAKILGECTVSKTAEEYNEVVCQAPPKLYELYYCKPLGIFFDSSSTFSFNLSLAASIDL